MSENVNIQVDIGTIILVAEILKEERGLDEPPVQDAVAALKSAFARLESAGVHFETEEEGETDV